MVYKIIIKTTDNNLKMYKINKIFQAILFVLLLYNLFLYENFKTFLNAQKVKAKKVPRKCVSIPKIAQTFY